jgi:hypothetical protein
MSTNPMIAGFELDIVYSDDLPGDTNGHCDTQKMTIIVRNGLPRQEREAVIFHELGHILWYRLFGSAESVDEEGLCRLCEFFSTFIQDNGEPGIRFAYNK